MSTPCIQVDEFTKMKTDLAISNNNHKYMAEKIDKLEIKMEKGF